MTDHIIQVLSFVVAGIIFWRGEAILNSMNKNCFIIVRLAFWFIVVGAFGLSVVIMQGYVPSVMVLLMIIGIALLLLTERRMSVLLRMRSTRWLMERRVRK
jgi:hypothetical protein